MSYRGRNGSIGTRGFSIRSGIPGLSFRQSWGKNAGAGALVVVVAALVVGAIALAIQMLVVLVPIIWQCLTWLALTTYDLCVYAGQRFKDWRSRSNV